MAFTIDNKTAQGSATVRVAMLARDTYYSALNASEVAANMTDEAQMATYTGFSGTLTQYQNTLANAVTALEDPAIQALINNLLW